MNVYPWELNSALSQDRLVVLARAAVTTRNRAFAEADRAAGDTNWGLACKAHERMMHTFGTLAGGGQHPWLTVVRDGLYVMPLIDDVPVRVFRGTADRPDARHLDALRLEHERAQPARPQIAFDFMGAHEDDDGPWYWLMAMETDEAGMVSRVVFFQANDAGDTRYPWTCPLEIEEPAAVTAEAAPAEAATAAKIEPPALPAEPPALPAEPPALSAEPLTLPFEPAAPPAEAHPAPAAEVHPAPVAEAHPAPAAEVHPAPTAEVHPAPAAEAHPAPAARGHGRRGRAGRVEPRQTELWDVIAAE